MRNTRFIKALRMAGLLATALLFLCRAASAQLDTSKWYALDGLYNNWGISDWCYSNSAVSVSGGYLTLTESSGSYNCQSHTGVPYRTGSIISKNFSFTYGVVRARVRFGDSGNTLANALWMIGGSSGTTGYPSTCISALEGSPTNAYSACSSGQAYETDIVDDYSSNTQFNSNFYVWNSHSKTTADEHTNLMTGGLGSVQLSQQYHVYEMDWFSDRMIFKVDGLTVATLSDTVSVPMFLIIDQELTYSASSYPVTTSVDWIRVCSDPHAACQPGDPTMVFDDEFNEGVSAPAPVARKIQGETLEGVSSQ